MIYLFVSVYGWGATSFTKAESQTPHDVPLAYFKGPSGVSLIVDINDTGLGTGISHSFITLSYKTLLIFLINPLYIASSDDYTANDNNQLFLPLNSGGTTSVTFRPDNFALEPDETIVFDLDLANVNPLRRTAEFDSNLPNVFFQERTVLSIQDSTGITLINNFL